MTRQEFADLVNASLGPQYAIDASYVGKLERGVIRYPTPVRRRAFRAALHASTDAEIGFWPLRRSSGDDAFIARHALTSATAPGAIPAAPPPTPLSHPTADSAPVAVLTLALSYTVESDSGGDVRVVIHLQPTDPAIPAPVIVSTSAAAAGPYAERSA